MQLTGMLVIAAMIAVPALLFSAAVHFGRKRNMTGIGKYRILQIMFAAAGVLLTVCETGLTVYLLSALKNYT